MDNITGHHHTNTSEAIMPGPATGGSNRLGAVTESGKVVKEIHATHAHDAREVEVTPILNVVQDILHRANLGYNVASVVEEKRDLVEVLEEKVGSVAAGPKGTMLEALAVDIQKVCCEFSCKCTGGDTHASTMAILNTLGRYSWDAKVVIALAAFSVSYGELWLVILLRLANNTLAKSIAALKQTPEVDEINGVLKPQFTTIDDITKVVVDVANSLIEFRLLPSKYISPEDPPLATATNQIAVATYWTIRSIVACGSRITSNIGITSGLITSTVEAWDLSSLVHKEKSIHDHLRQRLSLCYEFIEARKNEERYNNLVQLFQTPQRDNVRNLKELIYPKDDIQPLIKVSAKKRVNVIDVLKGKTVLLFISDLDVSEEEVMTLAKIYKESRKGKDNNELANNYEVVWLPIVDKASFSSTSWTKEHENRFKELQYQMSWYTLCHPSLLDDVSIRFVKEQWGFAKKPIVVSLNPVAKVVSTNALHMILIWGNLAYPFTSSREEELWKKQAWTLDFVVDSIHPDIPKWITQEKTHICLFGGEDIQWIRKFITSTKDYVSKIPGLKLELVYIGKHHAKEVVKKIITTINSDHLAHTLPDWTHIWFFWAHLESMLYSKMLVHGSDHIMDNDYVFQQVMSTLNLGGGYHGWGIIGSSKSQIIHGKGDEIVEALSKIVGPGKNPSKPEFNCMEELNIAMQSIVAPGAMAGQHCNRLELPAIDGAGVPRVVTCLDCHRPMEKYILYKCYTG